MGLREHNFLQLQAVTKLGGGNCANEQKKLMERLKMWCSDG